MTLRDLFNDESFSLSHCAHIGVDIQEHYFKPQVNEDFKNISLRIAQRISPAFGKISLKSYWVWMHPDRKRMRPDFYIVRPNDKNGDEVVRKYKYGAFHHNDLKNLLDRDNKKILFLTGFFANVCVSTTALQATSRGFRVVLLTDCTDFENLPPSQKVNLEQRGVIFASSEELIENLNLIDVKHKPTQIEERRVICA